MQITSQSKIRKHITPYLFLSPALLLMVVFVYEPVIQNLRNSFYKWSAFSVNWEYVGWENFRRVLYDEIVYSSLLNNFWYAVISVAFQVCFALMLAALIESHILPRLAGNFFRTVLFLPSVLAITIIGVMWQLIYNPSIGLINQFLSQIGLDAWRHTWLGEEDTAIFSIIAVSQWQWTGYIMILFIVAIQAIPKDLYESARIDGANGIQQFWYITLPGVQQTFLVMVIITVIGAMKVFDIVWVMTAGGPNHASETIGNYLYRVGFRNDEMGYASALAIVMFVITFMLSIIQLRMGGGTRKEVE